MERKQFARSPEARSDPQPRPRAAVAKEFPKPPPRRPRQRSPPATANCPAARKYVRLQTSAHPGRCARAPASTISTLAQSSLAPDRGLARTWHSQPFSEPGQARHIPPMGAARRSADQLGDLLKIQSAPQVSDNNLPLLHGQLLQRRG